MLDNVAVPRSTDEVTGSWLAAALGHDQRFRGARWAQIEMRRIGEGFGLDGMLLEVRVPGAATPSLVVKLANWSGSHTEPHFYKAIAPHMPCRLPACYGAATDSGRFVLLLEDLGSATQGDCLVGATDSQTEALVEAVARYHARFWGGSDPVVADRSRFVFDPNKLIDNFEVHRQRFLQRFSNDIGPEPNALLEDMRTRAAVASDLMTRAVPTLIHTDLHLDNVLFLEDDPVILDWPGAALGPGVIDLARILIEAMTLDQRRRRHDGLVTLYCDVLEAEGVDASSPEEFNAQLEAACVWMCWTTFEWAGSKDPGLDRPRVLPIVQSVVRNSFTAAQEGWLRVS